MESDVVWDVSDAAVFLFNFDVESGHVGDFAFDGVVAVFEEDEVADLEGFREEEDVSGEDVAEEAPDGEYSDANKAEDDGAEDPDIFHVEAPDECDDKEGEYG